MELKHLKERILQPYQKLGFPGVLLSCSGGPDSSLLLQLLAQLQQQYSVRVTVLHINFGLRGEDSEKDESFVAARCKSLGLPLVLHRASLRSKSSAVLEKTRDIRLELSKKLLPSWLMVEGHHLNDQIESFLFRLFRGSSLSGLRPIEEFQYRSGRAVLRPLLCLSKKQVLGLMDQESWPYRLDESNWNLDYDRNWIRHELMPLVESRFPQAVHSIRCLQKQIADEDYDIWSSLEEDYFQLLQSSNWNRNQFKRWSPALRKRLLHRLISEKSGRTVSRQQLEELSQAFEAQESFSWNAPKGFVLRVKRDSMSLEAPS